jgi:hypothetical protein
MFDPRDNAMAGLPAVNYFIVDDDGEMKAEAWNTLNVKLDQANYQEALRQGVVTQETFQVDPGPMHAPLKLIVYNPKTDTVDCIIKPAW